MTVLARMAIVAAAWCLPFVPVRVPIIGGSVPVVVFGAVGVIGLLSYLMSSGVHPTEVLDRLDLYLLAYVVLSAVGTLWSPSPSAPLALLKSSGYFAAYLGLKALMLRFRREEVLSLVRSGALLGVATLIVGAVVAVSRVGVSNLLSGPFGYWTFTYVLFRELLGGDLAPDFTGADVMINAVGEGAAVFAMLLLLGSTGRWTGSWRMLTVSLAIGLAALTFSRRAVFALIAGLGARIIAGPAEARVRMSRLAALAGVTIIVVAASEVVGGFFQDPTRVAQVSEVYRSVAESPLTGVGYASRVSGGRYVHNFLVGSLYGLGIPGFVLALTIMATLAVRLLKGVVARRHEAAPLLVFPLVGLAVASTVEGIMTFSNWFVLALYWRLSTRQEGTIGRHG